MNQKNIREHNGTAYTVPEASEAFKEFDDRTKSNKIGYNSIEELARITKKNFDSSGVGISNLIGTATTPTATGWFKIGKIDTRGGGTIILSFTGGSAAPVTYFIKYFKDYSTNSTLLLEKYGASTVLRTVRIRKDTSENKFYIEIYAVNNSTTFPFNVYHKKNLGYNLTSEVYTGVLVAGSTNGTTYREIPFANGVSSYDIEAANTVKCTSLIETSDKKFKSNIELIDGEWALSVFKKLNFSFYDFSKTNSKQAGLIAQEVEKILPLAVHTSENGDKGLNHTYIDMVCKAAIQHFIKT